MLQIKLAEQRKVDPTEDPLGRSTVGATPGMSEREAWEAGRGCWVMKASRAIDEDEVRIVNPSGTILAVAKIRGLIKHGNRLEVVGDLLTGDPRVGTTVELNRAQNPISYV
ncbi:hypothetical protein MOD31_20185 [Paenarthrobacter sp. TYUT067]|uniref:hypothetical protein n=1 Tax=Paenarthrobacter sp. TYUT067 TaxID=2926245 RepID=UPI002030BC9E|nr:hypothetical protein [Paenarthrobacter sp. TYUT067]MCM0618349.1 hypothetical protein [Paenarthrobacter sp. TYUT067]